MREKYGSGESITARDHRLIRAVIWMCVGQFCRPARLNVCLYSSRKWIFRGADAEYLNTPALVDDALTRRQLMRRREERIKCPSTKLPESPDGFCRTIDGGKHASRVFFATMTCEPAAFREHAFSHRRYTTRKSGGSMSGGAFPHNLGSTDGTPADTSFGLADTL